MEIEGYPNYLIYDDGRVWSKKRKKFLSITLDKSGYPKVSLWDKKVITLKIHRLLAQTYIPNPHNYPQVDHINRIKTDNRIENLRWASQEINSNNRGHFRNNTSGHKYIIWYPHTNKWVFQRVYYGKRHSRYFKTKSDAVCYKYIWILRQRAGHYD